MTARRTRTAGARDGTPSSRQAVKAAALSFALLRTPSGFEVNDLGRAPADVVARYETANG
jgi:hypothetical protein